MSNKSDRAEWQIEDESNYSFNIHFGCLTARTAVDFGSRGKTSNGRRRAATATIAPYITHNFAEIAAANGHFDGVGSSPAMSIQAWRAHSLSFSHQRQHYSSSYLFDSENN